MPRDIKPCPFCGGVPEPPHCFRTSDPSGKWGMVICTTCGSCGPEARTGYPPHKSWGHDAIKEWNRRVRHAERTPPPRKDAA